MKLSTDSNIGAILSIDLITIETEIHAQMRKAGEAIFEIGRRLKHVKDNDLVHGQWTAWLEKMDIPPRQAQRYIQVYNELGEYATALSEMPFTKLITLAQIAGDTENVGDLLERKHELPNGKTKTVDSMTTRELEQLKRELVQKDAEINRLEELAEQARKSEEKAIARLEQAEPEIVEIDTTDYSDIERLRQYEEKFGAIENYSDRVRATNVDDVTTSIISFSKAIRDLLKRHTYLIEYQDTVKMIDGVTRREYNEAVTALKRFANEIEHCRDNTGTGEIIEATFQAV